jgi:hypothetical protein
MTGPVRSGHPATPPSTAAATVHGPAVDDGDAAESLDLDDPQRRLRIALSGCADPAIRPEDLLLDWLIGLADGLDPAAAAQRLVAAADPETTRNDRLLSLLAEVAQWPLLRLARLGGARRIRACRQKDHQGET